MSSRKKKTLLLAGLFAVCFVAALVIFFVRSVKSTQYEHAVYSAMEEPSLPVIYAVCGGLEVNPMRGHLQDMGNEACDTVTIVPADRRLPVSIKAKGMSIKGISYEIRNLSLDHFIEKTELTDFTEESAVLPIQNLINKDEPYLLCITLDIGESRVNYYTKIIWTEKTDAGEMLKLAVDFNGKTYDYEAARELTQYMETDPAITNEDLGTVTIGSSYQQLTWGDTGMKPAGEPEIYLREYQGMCGEVELIYRTATDEESFINTDYFNMRTGPERLYVMNYRRSTREIFDGARHRFSGRTIMLGISNPDALSAAVSPEGRFVAFKTDKELWSYDQQDFTAVNIFSFRSGEGIDCRDHDIKILSVGDDGQVDFAVYGYMNRGMHEGYNGLLYYSYSPSQGVITERFFVPVALSFERIREELSDLCASGTGDMFYFRQNNTVYAVDLKSLETMEVVSGLTEGSFASSKDNKRFAFLEKGIKVMDIDRGTTELIEAGEGEVLQILSFNDSDLVTGISNGEDAWYEDGLYRSLPIRAIRIYDGNMDIIKEYGRNGLYIDDFEKTGNRFVFNLLRKSGSGFIKEGMDTIVCAGEAEDETAGLYKFTNSGEKQRVYYVSVNSELKNTKKMKVDVPDSISCENSGTVDIRVKKQEDSLFYAYRFGHLAGRSGRFSKALLMCYDDFGCVKDSTGNVIYERSDRATYHTIREFPQEYELCDIRGTSVEQALYFIYKGFPVTAKDENGNLLTIYGYDAKTVKVKDPEQTLPRDADLQVLQYCGK